MSRYWVTLGYGGVAHSTDQPGVSSRAMVEGYTDCGLYLEHRPYEVDVTKRKPASVRACRNCVARQKRDAGRPTSLSATEDRTALVSALRGLRNCPLCAMKFDTENKNCPIHRVVYRFNIIGERIPR